MNGRKSRNPHPGGRIEHADRKQELESAPRAAAMLARRRRRGDGVRTQHDGEGRGRDSADRGDHDESAMPAHCEKQQRCERGKGRLSDIAGKIVDAERTAPRRAEGGVDDRRGARMLRRRTEARQRQRHAQRSEARRRAGQREGGGRHQRAADEGGPRTVRAVAPVDGNLRPRHRRRQNRPHEAERRIAEPELDLPQWQQDVDEVHVSVVDDMGETGRP
jgi:hypothetical protein